MGIRVAEARGTFKRTVAAAVMLVPVPVWLANPTP